MLENEEYLKNIGAAARSKIDGRIHPTAAGMLMFGNEYDIVREFPEYFLDYRETLDPTIRWTDRLQSSSGEWSGNVFDFYFRVYNKMIKDVKIPFKVVGGVRIDDTPVHKALREALANCLVNTDFYVPRGVVIKKDNDLLVLENPGYIRTGKEQMRKGGESDPRNKALMKMFNLVNIGERAGSGVPDIFKTWEEEGFEDPVIEERYGDASRTSLILSFKKNVAISSDKVAISSDKEYSEHERNIVVYLERENEISNAVAREITGLSAAGVRKVLKKMVEKGILSEYGKNKSRKYFLK